MILIADSGSTKTDWRLIDKQNSIVQGKTVGFNPFYQTTQEISTEIQQFLLPQLNLAQLEEVEEVHYYGAGCSTTANIEIVYHALTAIFPQASIAINNDLLAAARALCDKEAGIVGILGTGSNTCFYDGEKIAFSRPNLGFVLGDEGSGAVLGKNLVTAYLYEEMPPKLMERFSKRYDITREDVMDHVYKKPFPNRYMASFSQFLYHNLKEPFIYRLVYDSFSELFDRHILKYERANEHKVHFVGSIAFYYSNLLRQVANDKGVTLRNIMESPIAGLTLFHQQSAIGRSGTSMK